MSRAIACAALCFALGYSLDARAQENGDGSLTVEDDGDVEVQFLRSRALFQNALTINGLSVTSSTAMPCSMRDLASAVIPGCLLDTDICAADCPTSGVDFTCDCKTASRVVIGNTSSIGRTLHFRLYTDSTVPHDHIADRFWDADKTLNNPADNFDHLRTSRLDRDLYLIEFEDGLNGGDQDYNDLVAVVRVIPPGCSGSNPPAYCTASV